MSHTIVEKKRTIGLDFLKYVCCFLVIVIHSKLSLSVDNIVLPITRIAVPIFFMITGYFYTQLYEKNRVRNQIAKIFRLTVFSTLLYVVWDILKILINGKSVINYLKGFLNLRRLFNFFVFNQPIKTSVLWYLGALLYVLIIAYFLRKIGMKSFKKLYYFIPVLLLFNLILGNFSPVFFGKNLDLFYSRNFLFAGLPFFLIGDMFYNIKLKLKNKILIPTIIISAITSVAENYVMREFLNSKKLDVFISTIILSCAVFIFAIENENYFSKSSFCVKIAEYGRKYTLVIYIVHMMLVNSWEIALNLATHYFSKLSAIRIPLNHISPIVFLISATVIAWAVSRITKNKKLKERKGN